MMNKEEIKTSMLKSTMYSALLGTTFCLLGDKVDYAIWLLLMAIFIKMNLGGKE